MMDNDSRQRWIVCAVCCVLVALPYLFVTYPPSTDLAQHVAQIRLFSEVWLQPQDVYRVQLNTPYNLGYLLIGIFYYLAGPLAAGRLALAAVAIMWTVAIHLLAARRRAPVAAAVLATVFVFNHTFAWGLYNFIFGWPAFVVWLLLTTRPNREEFTARDALKYAATALVLYYSHAFWFAAAVGWLAISLLIMRPSRRVAVRQIASVVPVAVLAAVWYVSFSTTWYATNTGTYAEGYSRKLSLYWWSGYSLGSIVNTAEQVIVFLAAAWILASVAVHWRSLRTSVDVPLAAAALMFVTVAIALPYNFQNTVIFGERWLPFAFILALLAVPAPLPRPRTVLFTAFAVLALLSASTTQLWVEYEQLENEGLTAAVAALPENARVVGLDYIKDSAYVRSYPFMQTVAYAQVLKGARINFSFAEFPQSLVVYNVKGRYTPPWTPQLEWFAHRVTASDFQYFDYALVNADPVTHGITAERFGLTPVTTEGRWRLYRTPRQ